MVIFGGNGLYIPQFSFGCFISRSMTVLIVEDDERDVSRGCGSRYVSTVSTHLVSNSDVVKST